MRPSLVRDWMSFNPIGMPSTTPLPDAHNLMVERKIRRLLVIDEDQLQGIVTRRDIRNAEPPESAHLSIYELNRVLAKLTLDRIMTRNPLTIAPTAPITEAAHLMLTHNIAGLPVLANTKVVGILTESDIFRMCRVWNIITLRGLCCPEAEH